MTRQEAMLRCTAGAITVLLGLSSCGGLLQAPKGDALASTPLPAKAPVLRLAQLDRGRDSYFAQCVEPLCPDPTPKTLAVASAVKNTAAPTSFAPQRPTETSEPGPTPRISDAPTVQKAQKAQVLVLLFATDSATLTPAHKAQLSEAAPALGHAERIRILGRTDNVGPAGPNEAIALARAWAVRDHLKRVLTYLPDDIRVDARGLCCYAGANDSAEGRARNRRVEVVFPAPAVGKP